MSIAWDPPWLPPDVTRPPRACGVVMSRVRPSVQRAHAFDVSLDEDAEVQEIATMLAACQDDELVVLAMTTWREKERGSFLQVCNPKPLTLNPKP